MKRGCVACPSCGGTGTIADRAPTYPTSGGRCLACLGDGYVTKPWGGRVYYDAALRFAPASRACEHCDGERSTLVRSDYMRGLVCPDCDSSLDEMLSEGPSSRARSRGIARG